MGSMFSPAVKRQYVALGALLLLFGIACSSTTPTATPTKEPVSTPNTTAPAAAEPPTLATGNQVGDLAPDFTLTEISTDQSVQLANLTGQGRPVVLYFFTTW